MVCSQLVQGGGGTRLLAQPAAWLPIFIFILFSFSSLHSILPHCYTQLLPTHIYTLWFQKCLPLLEPALFCPSRSDSPTWHDRLTLNPLWSNKHIRALRPDELHRHEVKIREKLDRLYRRKIDNDHAGWENKKCDGGNGISFWAYRAIFSARGMQGKSINHSTMSDVLYYTWPESTITIWNLFWWCQKERAVLVFVNMELKLKSWRHIISINADTVADATERTMSQWTHRSSMLYVFAFLSIEHIPLLVKLLRRLVLSDGRQEIIL